VYHPTGRRVVLRARFPELAASIESQGDALPVEFPEERGGVEGGQE
jgi:hypothetical protein